MTTDAAPLDATAVHKALWRAGFTFVPGMAEAFISEYDDLTRPPLLDLPDKPAEADRNATYQAALAHGLSDYEAREEGWPASEVPPHA